MKITNIQDLRNELANNFTLTKTNKMIEGKSNACTKTAHAILKTIALEQTEKKRIGDKSPIAFMKVK